MHEILENTQNFCSVVSRKKIRIRNREIIAIFKEPRNAFELNLLKNEILFYKKIAPLYRLLYRLHFARGKFCPTLFDFSIKKNN